MDLTPISPDGLLGARDGLDLSAWFGRGGSACFDGEGMPLSMRWPLWRGCGALHVCRGTRRRLAPSLRWWWWSWASLVVGEWLVLLVWGMDLRWHLQQTWLLSSWPLTVVCGWGGGHCR
jgi:hypothetical protein